MPDTEKIWAWCDRHQNLTGIPHALLVFKTSRVSFFEPYNIPIWIAVAQECREYWVCIQDAEGSTPEEAIAKLAETLGL